MNDDDDDDDDDDEMAMMMMMIKVLPTRLIKLRMLIRKKWDINIISNKCLIFYLVHLLIKQI